MKKYIHNFKKAIIYVQNKEGTFYHIIVRDRRRGMNGKLKSNTQRSMLRKQLMQLEMSQKDLEMGHK